MIACKYYILAFLVAFLPIGVFGQEVFEYYGYYCGPGTITDNNDGPPPINEIDAVCKKYNLKFKDGYFSSSNDSQLVARILKILKKHEQYVWVYNDKTEQQDKKYMPLDEKALAACVMLVKYLKPLKKNSVEIPVECLPEESLTKEKMSLVEEGIVIVDQIAKISTDIALGIAMKLVGKIPGVDAQKLQENTRKLKASYDKIQSYLLVEGTYIAIDTVKGTATIIKKTDKEFKRTGKRVWRETKIVTKYTGKVIHKLVKETGKVKDIPKKVEKEIKRTAEKVKKIGKKVFSDARLKKNIEPIHDALDKILQLHGVSYEWEVQRCRNLNLPSGRDMGIIAQEVEKVFPEVVENNKDNYKMVKYSGLIAVLIEAIREQQRQIKALEEKIERMEKKQQEFCPVR